MISGGRAITAPLSGLKAAAERLFVPSAIFFGATLLFAVEPIIAKMILPWFGGSAEVWIVCLLFFQAALLAGYLYAHLIVSFLNAFDQMRVHLFLLATSLLFLPIIPAERWKPAGGEEPLILILSLLSSTIGLPFILLASSGPLIQNWLSQSPEETEGNRNVYRLYALSNIGSLLALLLYPVLIEPWLTTSAQAKIWSALYCVFAVLSAAIAWKYRNRRTERLRRGTFADSNPSFGVQALWFMLALAPSALLLAITNYMLRNIAAIPLLWVIPLALYLLSFIICFDHPRWNYRPLWYVLFAGIAGTMTYNVVGLFLAQNYMLQLAFYGGGLFVFCMLFHGELASMKPAPNHLTTYYLAIAFGGAAGGTFIAVVAPLLFNDDYDLPLVLATVTLMAIFVAWRHVPVNLPAWLRWNALICLFYCWAFVTGHMALAARDDLAGNLMSLRNFYGPLRVTKQSLANREEMIQLRNGNVVHGREFTDIAKICEPTSYYGRQSGIGIAIQEKGKAGPLKVGVIGLGTGTLAGYGRKGDTFRFYEINPLVSRLASDTFHYFSCPGTHSVVLGDARLSLEREPEQHFDLLVVDAFTSDAIPIHLLTSQAFALYWRHLKHDGVLAVHVSNQYINLSPIIAAAARESGKIAQAVTGLEYPSNGIDRSVWLLVTTNRDFFLDPALNVAQPVDTDDAVVWTDNYSNLWRALN